MDKEEFVPYELKDRKDEAFKYLDELRESGVINMFGATPYLQCDLRLSCADASKLLAEWMDTFGERHPY